MITRLEAIQDILLGRGIACGFEGHETNRGVPHTFNAILRRTPDHKGVEMVFDCSWYGSMPRKNGHVLPIRLTAKQVLGFIRRNYRRHVQGDVRVQETLRDMPVARVSSPTMSAVA